MFFRTKTINGSKLTQLVQSYRNDEGQPRQRVVVSLGDIHIPEAERKVLAKVIENHLSGVQDMLLPDSLSTEATEIARRAVKLIDCSRFAKSTTKETLDGVLVDEVEVENTVQYGPEAVVAHAWRELDMDEHLSKVGFNPSQRATACMLVANRLIEPSSEWSLISWSKRTALPEMLNLRLTKTGKDRLYHVGDLLYEHRHAIEASLRQHEADLFGHKTSIVLYDVTNTHFEGLCAKNPKAKHGKNKQKRNDCRQVAIGMAFDEFGFALTHEVFAGNISDTKTLEGILDQLGAHLDAGSDHILILDAGFASKSNVAMLEKRGMGYIINQTRKDRSRWKEEFESEGFVTVPGREKRPAVEVKVISDPESPKDDDSKVAALEKGATSGPYLLLCRSAARREKEVAILSKAENRFLGDVTKLRRRIEAGRLKQEAAIERAIGRLLKSHPRVARFYEITHLEGTLVVSRKDASWAAHEARCGEYVLRTNRELPPSELWNLYMTLLQAEEGFACLKGTLGLRPNFHQLEHRVEAHIFLTILSYHVLTWIREKLRLKGDPRKWTSLRRILSTHMVQTVVLPLLDGQQVRVRKVGRPDLEQEQVYQLLDVNWREWFPTHKRVVKVG